MKYLFFIVALITISSYQLKEISADCPPGYELKHGDIPGWGQVGKNPSIERNPRYDSESDNQNKDGDMSENSVNKILLEDEIQETEGSKIFGQPKERSKSIPFKYCIKGYKYL